MNILVIGAGAIGCLVGGRLALVDHQVTLVGRQSFVDAVTQSGLQICEGDISTAVPTISVAANVMDALEQPPDLVLLSVKSYDTNDTLQELLVALAAKGLSKPHILSLQNGVGNEQAIANAVSGANVIAGTITTPVSVLSPGIVEIEKPNLSIGLSPWHPAMSQSLFKELQAALREAGFDVTVYANAQSMKWSKLLLNMVGNASSAILGLPPEDVFVDPQLANLEIAAWREAMRVMRAQGIPPVNIDHYSFTILTPLILHLPLFLLRGPMRSQIAGARGGKMPSLYLDLMSNKKKSEVRWLNGAVVEAGMQVGVPTPVNGSLTNILSDLTSGRQHIDLWHNAKTRLIVATDEYRNEYKRRES